MNECRTRPPVDTSCVAGHVYQMAHVNPSPAGGASVWHRHNSRVHMVVGDMLTAAWHEILQLQRLCNAIMRFARKEGRKLDA